MLLIKSKLLMGLTLSALLCGIANAQPAAAAKNWKDRAEYDLAQEVGKAQGQKKIELLDQWKQKYPDSDFKLDRVGIYISTYQAMNKPKEMYESSKEFIALDPKNITVISYITSLAIGQNEPDQAEKAANQLLGMLPETFDPSKKPAAVTDEAFKTQRTQLEALANSTLYALVKAKKDPVLTEAYIRKSLATNPVNGSMSFDMGTAILQQKKVERYPEAFWHFARGASLTGSGALPDASKKQALDYITKIYTNYKGSKKGLDTLISSAMVNPFPPEKFSIMTDAEELGVAEEELKKTNPQLALWIAVKKALIGPEGDQYFKDSVKESAVPPMKGKVISHKPALKPKEIVVAVADATTPEITIIIAEGGSLPGKADPGTEIEFESVAKSLVKDPFMMTVEVEPGKIKGWPTPIPAAAPGVKKAAPAVKKAVQKKK